MMTADEFSAIELMVREGGGFVSALGNAWMKADPTNRAKLHAAFPEYYEQYESDALTRQANHEGHA